MRYVRGVAAAASAGGDVLLATATGGREAIAQSRGIVDETNEAESAQCLI
jgi:hypothetical protein